MSEWLPPPGWGYPPLGEPRPHTSTNTKAVASLVCAMAGFSFCLLGVPLGLAAVVLGRQARNEMARRPGEGGYGLAQAGFVIGIIDLVLFVPATLVVVAGALS